MAVEVKFPALSEPNDGFDENDRWLGMTPEEVEEFIRDFLRLSQLVLFTPHGEAN